MAILDIRGTHGSGKSWLVRNLIMGHTCRTVTRQGEAIGYRCDKPSFSVVGLYRSGCGGCDGIKSAAEIARRVRSFCRKSDHVVMEGILVAHTFERYSEMAKEFEEAGYGYKFLFLDTPLEECIRRVVSRRKDTPRGRGYRPFKTYNLERDWHRIWGSLRRQCEEAGHRTRVLDWRDPLPALLEELHQ